MQNIVEREREGMHLTSETTLISFISKSTPPKTQSCFTARKTEAINVKLRKWKID